MRLSILICTYRRPELLRKILGDLISVVFKDSTHCELIVIDNGGDFYTKKICDEISNHGVNIHYVHEPKPGLSAARNRAVSESSGDWLLFLDDDIRCESDFVQQMLEALKNTDEAIIIPRIITPIDKDWPDWLRVRLKSGVGQYDLGNTKRKIDTTTKVPVGACMCLNRSVYNSFGPFEEGICRNGEQPFGGEETLLLSRAFESGMAGVYVPHIYVRHEFISTNKVTKNYWIKQGFYGGRSRVRILIFSKKDKIDRKYFLYLSAASLLKSFLRLLAALAGPKQAFENQYRAIAHFGIAYESLYSFKNHPL